MYAIVQTHGTIQLKTVVLMVHNLTSAPKRGKSKDGITHNPAISFSGYLTAVSMIQDTQLFPN